jgi:hypothetical protein
MALLPSSISSDLQRLAIACDPSPLVLHLRFHRIRLGNATAQADGSPISALKKCFDRVKPAQSQTGA